MFIEGWESVEPLCHLLANMKDGFVCVSLVCGRPDFRFSQVTSLSSINLYIILLSVYLLQKQIHKKMNLSSLEMLLLSQII